MNSWKKQLAELPSHEKSKLINLISEIEWRGGLPLLIELHQSADGLESLYALATIGEIGGVRARRYLLSFIESAPVQDLTWVAINALNRWGTARPEDSLLLLQLFENACAKSEVRREAVNGLTTRVSIFIKMAKTPGGPEAALIERIAKRMLRCPRPTGNDEIDSALDELRMTLASDVMP